MLQCENKTDDGRHLPFVERFRPKKLDEVESHKNTIITLKKFIKTKNIPHLLFYGPPGTGKTSTIESFVIELYGEENVEFMTMNINASEERGIEVVRNKIKNFVSTMPIYCDSDGEPNDEAKRNMPKYKFIILDEADAMTLDAQAMLRQVIENYTYNARFCLICNYIKRIHDAIQSRCTLFKFSPLDFASVTKKINQISNIYDIQITNDGIKTIWKLSHGDMRKVMHFLQIISINNKYIDSDIVTKFQKYPSGNEINDIYDILIEGKFDRSLKAFRELVKTNMYSLTDVLTELTLKITDDLIEKDMTKEKGKYILKNLRDVEMNQIVTSNSDIQICNIVAIFCKSFSL